MWGHAAALRRAFGVRHGAQGASMASLKGALRRANMEKDVVCGMQVDPAKAAGTSEYEGKTYYFCAKSCKTKFDANPSKFIK